MRPMKGLWRSSQCERGSELGECDLRRDAPHPSQREAFLGGVCFRGEGDERAEGEEREVWPRYRACAPRCPWGKELPQTAVCPDDKDDRPPRSNYIFRQYHLC